jgi:acetyl-CoA synthetase
MPREGDLFWTPADWAWIGGLFDVLFPALHWGLPVVSGTMAGFNPERAFDLMERWGVANTFLPPTALRMMRGIERPREKWELELETIACGGEPMEEATFDWAREELGITINEFYGQTEANLLLSNCNAIMPARPGSMGRPVPGHRVAVVDGEGNELPTGEGGEVAVRRPDPVMMLGYWNNEEATEEKLMGDWLLTRDLASVDEEGYFRFVGRDDDLTISAGYRIGPAEIEDALARHREVAMAAALGKPDEIRGQAVKAFVVLQEGREGDEYLVPELQDLVKDHLGKHEYPREVEFVGELPTTPTGKIKRNVLREREEEGARG